MHDETCEREGCDGCSNGGCGFRPEPPSTAPCICSMQELLIRGCTCGAMEAERQIRDSCDVRHSE